MDTGQHAALIEENPLRFDHERHEYIDVRTGEVLPNITSMLQRTKDERGKPWVDTRWFTDESRWRGTEVHRLTLDLDLDAITLDDIPKRHPQRGYLEAYAAAMATLPHEWHHLEEPLIHPVLRFGGTPDRGGLVYKLRSVFEVKTGDFHKSHPIQTALQAILASRCWFDNMPPHTIGRFVVYISSNGRFKVEEHVDHADIRRAQKVLRDCIEV